GKDLLDPSDSFSDSKAGKAAPGRRTPKASPVSCHLIAFKQLLFAQASDNRKRLTICDLKYPTPDPQSPSPISSQSFIAGVRHRTAGASLRLIVASPGSAGAHGVPHLVDHRKQLIAQFIGICNAQRTVTITNQAI